MTTITYLEDGIIIDGHAGNHAVCHGISAISQMVSGFVLERSWGDVLISDGHLEIKNSQGKKWYLVRVLHPMEGFLLEFIPAGSFTHLK